MDKRAIVSGCRERLQSFIKKGMYGLQGLLKDNQFAAVYLVVTQACNAKCSYCYQPALFRQSKVMSRKIANDSILFMNRTLGSKARYQIFGGEPLLNFDTVKYIIDKYPQLKFDITTNGIMINEDKDIYNWILSQKHHLDLTISCSAQREYYGKDKYMEKIKPCVDVLRNNGTEFHYVVSDPFDPDVFDEIKALYDLGVHVKVSSANCGSALKSSEGVGAYLVLFKKIVDYLYFGDKPTFGLSAFDRGFEGSVAKSRCGKMAEDSLPSTFCGCGNFYLAVNDTGDIYPCDYFIAFPEMKVGNIYTGLDEKSRFFNSFEEWTSDVYSTCGDCEIDDMRLCTRANCLAENYEFTGHPLKPTKSHCNGNIIEYKLFNYMMDEAKKRNIDISKARLYRARSLQ